MADKNGRKELHGNNAKIDPKKKVISQYSTNMAATIGKETEHNADLRDESLTYAKHFVEENKK